MNKRLHLKIHYNVTKKLNKTIVVRKYPETCNR